MPSAVTKVALVGSGFIADVHLQVLRSLSGVQVVALVDPAVARAERLAKKHGIARVHDSVRALVEAGGVDAAHVLVPPGLHAEVARACLEGGLHVLVEKPMCLSVGEVEELTALARARSLVLGVNHNQTFHPAVMALKGHLAAGRLGRLEHLAVQHNVPLRQLQSGDVGHFLFATEANVLFEQGVHLFSIVHDLLGEARATKATASDGRLLLHGVRFFATWDAALWCERGTANVRMAFGRSMLEMTVHAIGSDGTAFVDLQTGACVLRRKTRWLPVLDQALTLWRGGVHLTAGALRTVVGYAANLFGLHRGNDPFLTGMRGSLGGFHAALREGSAVPCPPNAARSVVQMCHDVARAAGAAVTAPTRPALAVPGPARTGEVVVLGGNGYLGRHCVAQLRAAGRPVTLLVRRPQLLSAELLGSDVRVFAGDASDAGALARAFAGADTVLHLATAAGEDPAAVATAMPTAVRLAGEAALTAGVRRLVYASSIAALWLGDATAIAGDIGPDPQPLARGMYARGKIAAEHELTALRARGLSVVVVRPGVVMGGGGPFQHSGLGLWVSDNHCVGWGRGRTPLPLVLVDDCATALVAALHAPKVAAAYNLVGDVRLPARELVEEMRRRTGRDLHFHATPLAWMWLQEMGKHLIKVLARRPRELPQWRDLASRSCRAPLTTDDAKRDLGFHPEADRERFLQRLLALVEQP